MNTKYQEQQRQWEKMRNAIRRTIEQYPDWTNAQISKALGCNNGLVGRVRGSVKRPLDKAKQEQRRQTLVQLAVGYQSMGLSTREIAAEFTRMKIPTVNLKKLAWTTELIKALVKNDRSDKSA